jgi:hypothetical protein
MAGQLVSLVSDEVEQVWRWRYRGFLALGFKWPEAEKLAASEADLHRMAALIEQGCPLHTAERIES